MAASGKTPIQLYRTTTASAAPSAANLADGELAINTTDEKLYFKNASGTVKLLASSAGASGTVTSVAFSTGTTGLSVSGSPITSSGTITLSGTLAAANGGTGQSTYTTGDLLYASNSTTLSKLADVATGNALISGGVGAAPAWGKVGLTTHVSGTLPLGNGGTGVTTTPSNGQLLIGNGSGYTVANLTAGANITITNSAGGITIAASGGTSLAGQTDSGSPYETSLGYNAGNSNTTGVHNTAVGYNSMAQNSTGFDNTALGFYALAFNETGANNTAAGSRALFNNTTGYLNTAVGYDSMLANTTGWSNTAVGAYALDANTTGRENCAFGTSTLGLNTTGVLNAAFGKSALSGATTGSQNTALGANCGTSVTTGSNLTLLGYGAEPSSATATNEVTLGNASVATLRCQVTTITSLSDARDKTAIADLNAGVDFINALRPVRFEWNARDGSKVGIIDTGFIAQDLQAAQQVTGVEIPGLVYTNNPDKLEAGYGKLLPVLVKAIQELSAEVAALKAQIDGE